MRVVDLAETALSDEVHVVLLEPKGTLNTGDVRNDRTVEHSNGCNPPRERYRANATD